MQSPPTQLAEIARFCQKEGSSARDKVLLHHLQRIALWNPLLRAVTEVASFQQLRSSQRAQDPHTGLESGSRSVLEARTDPSQWVRSAEQSGARTADCRTKEKLDKRSSKHSEGSLRFTAAGNSNRETKSRVLSGNIEPRSFQNNPLEEAPQNQGARPLEGVPFLVKDVINVAGLRTLAGCELLLRAGPADVSADVVRRLQALGAVPVGKSAVPEACTVGRVDVQTSSRLHGVTGNPYRFSVTSGGSSGGSAVAVAVEMVPLAVGTDWAGSLRIPAAFCGVCTLRASRGRMTIQHPERTVPPMPLPSEEPRDGEIMTAGLFTRTIRDLQYVMEPLLERTRRAPFVHLDNATLAVTPSFPAVATDVRIQETLQRLPARVNATDRNGHCSARLVAGPLLRTKDIWQAYGIFSASLLAQGDPHEPDAPKASHPSLEDVRWARSVQRDTASAVDAFLDEQRCTAWILPVCGPLPFPHNPEHTRFHLKGHAKAAPYWPTMLGYVLPFSVSCNPVVAMPLSLVEGVPCGIQVVGRSGADEQLLSACALLESCLGPLPHPEDVNVHLRNPVARL